MKELTLTVEQAEYVKQLHNEHRWFDFYGTFGRRIDEITANTEEKPEEFGDWIEGESENQIVLRMIEAFEKQLPTVWEKNYWHKELSTVRDWLRRTE